MKKNFLFVFIGLISCFAFTGCNFFFHPNQNQTTTNVETTTTAPQFEISISYNDQSDSVNANDGTNLINYSASFPELTITGGNAAAEQKINDYFSNLNFNFVHTIQPTISEATQYYEGNASDPNFYMTPYEVEETFDMTRGDETCISFKQTDYSYLGGAHPGTMYSTVNFDTATGNVLDFADVVSDENSAYNFVVDYILNLMADPSYDGYFFDGYTTTVSNFDLNGRWFFSNDGFVVIFNEYDVAPYAAGHFEFTIPYTEFALLLDKYK